MHFGEQASDKGDKGGQGLAGRQVCDVQRGDRKRFGRKAEKALAVGAVGADRVT